jgi:integrase
MPRRRKGPRLYLEERANRDPVYCIRHGRLKLSTGFGAREIAEAEKALADYLVASHQPARVRERDPANIKVADVISIYADDVAANHARPKETAARLERLLEFFGHDTLLDINARRCAAYVEFRDGKAVARRELEDLRAAIRYHWQNGYCSSLTPVVLPKRRPGRERWLTRDEVARLVWAAWRLKEQQAGADTVRPVAQHVARFILLAVYTGTRAGAICGAALGPTSGKGWVDLSKGVFYRRPAGKLESKKRQPPVRLPERLLAHLRRWARLGISSQAVIEWHGKPVKRVSKAFRSVRTAAKLGPEVVPHTLRHTCATWIAQAGVPVWEAAGFLGMSVETFERVYGHHHPDYQQEVIGAFDHRSRARQKRDSYRASKREQ